MSDNTGAVNLSGVYKTSYKETIPNIGAPTIFVNYDIVPKGMNKTEYFNSLKNRLIEEGFNSKLEVQENSIFAKFKAWWNNSPTSQITFKNFDLRTDRLEAGGYARRNDPFSIIIYNGLSPEKSNQTVPLWKYVNASLHEIGHGIFGFTHDSKGMTNDPSSIMDYRSAYRNGAGFNSVQQNIIKNSIWGR